VEVHDSVVEFDEVAFRWAVRAFGGRREGEAEEGEVRACGG